MENYKLVNADKLDFDLQSIANKIREKSETNGELIFPSDFISKIDECVYLDFAVVGGTTQPSNPTENMIWVNTEVEITSWLFSSSNPSNPTNGMVWINVGASSPVEFNIFNTNGAKIYPLSVSQYINSVWVDMTAKSYQNGEWVDWYQYVFKAGTGEIIPFSKWCQANTSLTFTTNSINTYSNGINYCCFGASTNQKIDFTNIKTLYIDMVLSSNGVSGGSIGISNDNVASIQNWPSYVVSSSVRSGIIEIDVSSVTGSFYITFFGTFTSNIKNIYYSY